MPLKVVFAAFGIYPEYIRSKGAVTGKNLCKIQFQCFVSFGCYMVSLNKIWDHQNKPKTNFYLCMFEKDLKTFDSRINILHQRVRSLAGEHIFLKQLLLGNDQICIFVFCETCLSQNHPKKIWL